MSVFPLFSIINKLQGDLMESSSDEDSGLQEEQNSASVLDMEDLGIIMSRAKKAKVRIKCLSMIVTRHSARSSGVDPGQQVILPVDPAVSAAASQQEGGGFDSESGTYGLPPTVQNCACEVNCNL